MREEFFETDGVKFMKKLGGLYCGSGTLGKIIEAVESVCSV